MVHYITTVRNDTEVSLYVDGIFRLHFLQLQDCHQHIIQDLHTELEIKVRCNNIFQLDRW